MSHDIGSQRTRRGAPRRAHPQARLRALTSRLVIALLAPRDAGHAAGATLLSFLIGRPSGGRPHWNRRPDRPHWGGVAQLVRAAES